MKDPDDLAILELFSETEAPCLCLTCSIKRHEEDYPPMRPPRTPQETIMGLAYEAAIRETLEQAGLD